ncbi:Cytochrome c-type protein NrfH [Sporomusa aerivorans]
MLDTGQYLNRNALKLMAIGFIVAVAGMAMAGFGYAQAEKPQFCGSCHSMEQAYATWQASNHKQIECTECHLPNNNLAVKLAAKTQTGINDVYHEVLRDYPATIKVTAQGKKIIADNCLRCHQSTVETTGMGAGGQDCTKCHRSLVHGTNKSKGGIKVE